MLRDGQLEWWGWGFTYGSSVGIQLIDPTGKTTTIGSAPVDNLCEVGGVLTADNRVAGTYTLVITGSRTGGAAGETAASFHIVNTSRLGTSGGFQPTPAPMPTPTPTTPCMATAAIFCP
jgi:hypothetical protein